MGAVVIRTSFGTDCDDDSVEIVNAVEKVIRAEAEIFSCFVSFFYRFNLQNNGDFLSWADQSEFGPLVEFFVNPDSILLEPNQTLDDAFLSIRPCICQESIEVQYTIPGTTRFSPGGEVFTDCPVPCCVQHAEADHQCVMCQLCCSL